jgi:hypothetical protein
VGKYGSIFWWEPYRAAVRSNIADLRAMGVLKPGFWIRIVGGTGAVAAILLGAIIYLYPGIMLPWREIMIVLAFVPVMFGMSTGMQIIAPRSIDVHPEQLSFTRGQSGARLTPQQIDHVAVIDAPAPTLTVTYRLGRRQPRTRTFVLGPCVDRAALEAIIRQLTDVRTQRVA